jgi:glycogen phosphorylase
MNERRNKILEQYGCGSVLFSGGDDGLYERHLVFDQVIDPKKADSREQFEAAARSVRDVISQRWLETEKTYQQKNPKRVYYLSMEFLLGRSLANNVTNALLEPLAFEAIKKRGIDPLELLEMEPDAGLGNGGWARKAILNVSSSGKFSSDRTIAEYAAEIWNVKPCPV